MVNTLQDELNSDGDCSLREAITAANGNISVDACGSGAVLTDTITFTVQGTITVSRQLSVTSGGPLVVDGGEVITTSGGSFTRTWWVEAGSDLTLQYLSVINGVANDYGAGLYNHAASVTLKECDFMHNTFACTQYGCIGAGVFSLDGTLTVLDSLFRSNGAAYDLKYGGGIGIHGGSALIMRSSFIENTGSGDWYEEEDPGGGALWIASANVVVEDSSFIHNNGGHGGGAIANAGTLTVRNSTFANNYSLGVGGKGGAIDNFNSLTIINSTFFGNSAVVGGAISNHYGSIEITNSTYSGNSANYGGGINGFSPGSISLSNAIIANNQAGNDCSGVFIDQGHNLDSDGTCGLDPANGSMSDTDPHLGILKDNGGLTWTNALLWNSPAIDTGDDERCPITDQRGLTRPRDGNGDGYALCDIGAYELQDPLMVRFLPLGFRSP